jgi:beta-glucosidase-like glycosyl hydrolase
VLKKRPIGEAAVDHIRAGGDLCLICHQEELVIAAFEALLKAAERDREFAARVAGSTERLQSFKKKSPELRRRVPPPAAAKLERLSRELWEFSEQIRFQTIPQQADA